MDSILEDDGIFGFIEEELDNSENGNRNHQITFKEQLVKKKEDLQGSCCG